MLFNTSPRSSLWKTALPRLCQRRKRNIDTPRRLLCSMTSLSTSTSTQDAADGEYIIEPGSRAIVQDVAMTLASLVCQRSKEAIKRKGSFAIAIAGGSVVKFLGPLKEKGDVEFSKWHVFWVDERCVPHDDDESNFGGAMKALFGAVDMPRAQLYTIDQELVRSINTVAVERCAKSYQESLKALTPDIVPQNADGMPVFDLLLLGFGPDGHICSLFPHHELLKTTDGWILPVTDSPKPPLERITFSLPLVNAAREKVFIATGKAKAKMTALILEAAPLDGTVPAALVTGDVTWIIDSDGASKLSNYY